MKALKRAALAAVLALGIAACANNAPTTPQQTIYEVEGAYNDAATVIVAYKSLPTCGSPGATALCSKPEVIAQLKQADNAAYNALVAAETTARTPGAGANAQTALVAAQQAVAALTAISSTLQVK